MNEVNTDQMQQAADAVYSLPQVGDQQGDSEEKGMTEYQRGTAAPATSIMQVSDLTERRDAIKKVYKNVMQENIHYGKPFKDSDKPTLLKAGGELLCSTFMMAPKLNKEVKHLGDGHREVVFTCLLFHIPTGRYLGEGIGSCSTLESKYRYRYENRATDVPLPDVWDDKDNEDYGAVKSKIRKALVEAGENVSADADVWMTKENGNWVCSIKQKTENPDIANEYNTVFKIGKKRALNDAVLTATGASELFTQDLEDIAANQGTDSNSNNFTQKGKKSTSQSYSKKRTKRPSTHNTSQKTDKSETPLSEANKKEILKRADVLPTERKKKLEAHLKNKNPSAKWGKNTLVFLTAYKRLQDQYKEFEYVNGQLPPEYWDSLQGATEIKDLTFLNDAIGDAMQRAASGDEDPFDTDAITETE